MIRNKVQNASNPPDESSAQTHTDTSGLCVEPSVDLRPAPSGVDVIVRYMTRANARFATRNRIYQTVIDLMRKQEETTALESGAKP
jgi:hypothetical protein